MVTPQDLLKILADGKYHSGADMGRLFGVSRAAIWKVIQKLEQNYSLTVFAVKGKGYRLPQPLELLDKKSIVDNLLKKVPEQLQLLSCIGTIRPLEFPNLEQSMLQAPNFFFVYMLYCDDSQSHKSCHKIWTC